MFNIRPAILFKLYSYILDIIKYIHSISLEMKHITKISGFSILVSLLIFNTIKVMTITSNKGIGTPEYRIINKFDNIEIR